MATHRARRSRPSEPLATLVVALAALGAAVAVLAGRPDFVDPTALEKLTEIERLAPRDTSQLVLTPGLGQDNQWWNTLVAFMSSQVKMDDLKPTPDLGITHLGYSFSAADPALGLDQGYVRMLYIESDNVEHAEQVQRWLTSGRGAADGAYSTTISGHTVVLAASGTRLLAQLRKSAGGLGSTAAYRQDTARRDAGSLIWEDWGAYVKAAGASGGKPVEYSKLFYGATGFIEGSRWAGYSTSPAAGWNGRFQSGGIDPKLVSAAKVRSAIASYEEVLARDSQGSPMAADGGAGNNLRISFYVSHPGLVGQAGMGSPDLAFKPRAEGDTAFSFNPSLWLSGTSVTGTSSPEGASLFAYSISGRQINLTVTIREPSPAGRTPVRTFAPPPGPPPGSVQVPRRSPGVPDVGATPGP